MNKKVGADRGRWSEMLKERFRRVNIQEHRYSKWEEDLMCTVYNPQPNNRRTLHLEEAWRRGVVRRGLVMLPGNRCKGVDTHTVYM